MLQCSFFFFFLMIRRPPRSTLSSSSAASDVYKRQGINAEYGVQTDTMQVPATPVRLVKVIVGALVLLAAIEHRNYLRAAILYLIERLGLRGRKRIEPGGEDGPAPQDAFSRAAAHARSAAFQQTAHPGYEQQAKLYGLYKQATVGAVQIEEPSKLHMVEHAKWTAWNGNSSLSMDEAKGAYVSYISFLHPGWEGSAGEGADKAPAAKRGMGLAGSTMATPCLLYTSPSPRDS
eukprot:TRINITY_DN12457_c0_g1_i7.p1 TRINITY_DN12457_c0_g1~~TRINITY_DN12457_c0_g1_i7.p1  ORF type:complete len:233 (-),score=72.39 TRINITY_DN12457_c0_g1_i7:104-802(-)